METPNKQPTVVQVVALANRFLALKSSPGFHDLRLLCKMLEEEATGALLDYEGFDDTQTAMLRTAAQVSKRMTIEIFSRIDAAINNGRGLPGFQAETPGGPIVSERIAGSYF